MSRMPGRSAAAAMLLVPMGTRLFIEMSLYCVEPACACWMCPLIGLILASPVFLCLQALSDVRFPSVSALPSKGIDNVLMILPASLLLADCASVAALIAVSANITALNGTSAPVLLLPIFVVILTMLLLGADACGKSARIWLYFFALLMFVVIAAQLRKYNPAWLTPIFGAGIPQIISGSVRCAGIIALFSISWGISVPDYGKKHPLFYAMIGVFGASTALILFQMLFPVRTELTLTRSARLKMILSNGRIALSLQVVMIVIWYASLLHVICSEAVTASCLLERMLPKLKRHWLAFGIALLVFALACCGFEETTLFQWLERLCFPLTGGVLLLIALIYYIRSRRREG